MACHGCGRGYPAFGCYGDHKLSSQANLTGDRGSNVAVATMPRRAVDLADVTQETVDDHAPTDAEPTQADRAAEMKRDLRSWGKWLIVGGVAQLIFAWALDMELLDGMWGIVLLAIGVLARLMPTRPLYCLIGLALLVAGLSNVLGDEIDLITAFGVFQLYLAFQQVLRFRKYGRAMG
jgi:hypothetical protein